MKIGILDKPTIEGGDPDPGPVSGEPPVIAAVALTSGATGDPRSINLPTGIVAGNLLLMITHSRDSAIDSISGWSQVAGSARVWYRIATGSEGATVSLNMSGGGETAAIVSRITGHNPSVPPEMELIEGAPSENDPDPPPLTSSWAAYPNLVIASCGTHEGSGSYPSDCPLYRHKSSPESLLAVVWMACKESELQTDNPGKFTVSVTAATNYVARTIKVKAS